MRVLVLLAYTLSGVVLVINCNVGSGVLGQRKQQ